MKITQVLTLMAFLTLGSKAISIDGECAPCGCTDAELEGSVVQTGGSHAQISSEVSIESECAPCCNAQIGTGIELDAEWYGYGGW